MGQRRLRGLQAAILFCGGLSRRGSGIWWTRGAVCLTKAWETCEMRSWRFGMRIVLSPGVLRVTLAQGSCALPGQESAPTRRCSRQEAASKPRRKTYPVQTCQGCLRFREASDGHQGNGRPPRRRGGLFACVQAGQPAAKICCEFPFGGVR